MASFFLCGIYTGLPAIIESKQISKQNLGILGILSSETREVSPTPEDILVGQLIPNSVH